MSRRLVCGVAAIASITLGCAVKPRSVDMKGGRLDEAGEVGLLDVIVQGLGNEARIVAVVNSKGRVSDQRKHEIPGCRFGTDYEPGGDSTGAAAVSRASIVNAGRPGALWPLDFPKEIGCRVQGVWFLK